ncbi:MAG: hypothetical protein ACRDOE_02570 [Streptosporangiaceae bacterium]
MGEAMVGALGLVQRLTERVQALTENVETLAGRLDAFIVVVEKCMTRNGGGSP